MTDPWGDPTAEELPLSGGRMTDGIVRRGGQVRRPMGPWTPAVHQYLRDLESVGFAHPQSGLGWHHPTLILLHLGRDSAGAVRRSSKTTDQVESLCKG